MCHIKFQINFIFGDLSGISEIFYVVGIRDYKYPNS